VSVLFRFARVSRFTYLGATKKRGTKRQERLEKKVDFVFFGVKKRKKKKTQHRRRGPT
jgi:hypothetical protein